MESIVTDFLYIHSFEKALECDIFNTCRRVGFCIREEIYADKLKRFLTTSRVKNNSTIPTIIKLI